MKNQIVSYSISRFAQRANIVIALFFLAIVIAPSVFGASQTWSNAPVSSAWQTTNNWIGNAVPGALNTSGNADIATFNSPISGGGHGGAGNPITNDLQRGIRSIRFDTADCGAYVFGSSLTDNSLELTHLGDITISSATTNPIIFNQGVRMRVPNSTNQRYDFTNNAASPNATLYFNVISNATAGTRPWTAFLAGSNTGTNTIARIDDANGGAAGAAGAILLDKVGTGTWILSGANDLPQKTSASTVARVQVIEGTLIVKDPASLGTITAGNINITNTGVLQIDGITPNNAGMTLRNGGTIRMNGSGSINGLVVGAQAGLSATLRTTSASDVFTIASFGVVSGGASDSTLHFNGPGTMVLGSANTYVGKWSFNSGTNQISNAGALATGPNAHIAAGAILDTTPLGATTYTLTTGGLGANGTGTGVGSTAATIIADAGGIFDAGQKNISLTFTPTSFSGDTTHPALFVAQGTLSLNGNGFLVNNNGGTPLGVGTYRLVQQATGNVTLTGTPYALVSGAGLAAGTVAEISVSGGNVDMVVSAHVALNLKWKGGNPDNNWDKLTTANFDNGGVFAQFGTGDAATFDALGSAFPTVNLVGTLLPASVKVDTTANDYTLSGAGSIAGATSLVKVGAGTLNLQTVNTYVGGTVISNGTLRVGVTDAVPSAGAGDVAVHGGGVIDLNNFNDTINGLNGNGIVDNTGGSASILTVGNNNNNGTFGGIVKNTSGTLALVKNGNGSQSLTNSNSFTGGTTVNTGTLVTENDYALGGGDLAVNGGTVNVRTLNLRLGALTGSGGVIANNSTSVTNTLVITNGGDYNGSINDGTSGRIALRLLSGTLRLRFANNYSGGTYVASGASFQIGNTLGGFVGGFLIASNGSTLGLPGGSQPPGTPVSITTDSGLVTFTSGAEGNGWGSQFIGGVNRTNRFTSQVSLNGVMSFSNFLGVVQFANAGANSIRFNQTGGSGGDNTTFEFESGNVHVNNAQTVRLGEVVGGSGTAGIGGGAGDSTWIIGTKNTSTTFSGYFSGNCGLVKSGTGALTLDGKRYWTNQVTLPDTTVVDYTLFSNVVVYVNGTTVSNGVLKIIAPNNLTNSSSIVLAGTGAALDASSLGYATNQTVIDLNLTEQATNTVVVTNALVEILPGHSLGGVGSVYGSVLAYTGSTLNPGNVTGVLANGTGTGVLIITNNAALQGAINFRLNRTNAVKADQIAALTFSIDPASTIVVTNIGNTLRTGDKFTLFNQPVSGFGSVTLPTTDATGTIPYTWQNDLAVDGSITLTSGLNTNAPVLTNVVIGNTLDLTWPVDRTGWSLQVQTNAITVGISSNWFPVAGAATTNHVIVPIVRTNPTVFYRLNLPLP